MAPSPPKHAAVRGGLASLSPPYGSAIMSCQNGISSSMSSRLPPAPAIAGLRSRDARSARPSRSRHCRPLLAASGAIEHRQRRVEALQHDLGRVAVLAVLVLPFARLQRAFEINLRAFLEVLLGDLGEALAEDHDAMPFGLLAPLAGCLVAPAFRGRDPQIDDRAAVLGAADFGVGAQIADENDLVDAACHRSLSIHFPFHPTPGSPEVRGCRAPRPHLSP